MRALVWHGPNHMILEEIEAPKPEQGQALVRVTAVGICGSDIHGFTGESGRRRPGMVMGHELAGVVESVRLDAGNSLSTGDRVAVNPLSGCGECEYCSQGLSHICPDRRALGVNTGASGAFSQYVTAPVDNLTLLSDEVTAAEGALAEPLAVAVHAINLSGLQPGDPTVVLGGGTIGLCLLLVCRARGIGPVYLSERLQHRLEVAKALGALVVPAEGDAADRILEATGGKGVRSSLEAVGIGPTIAEALKVTQRGGRVVLVGLASPSVELTLYELVPQERALQGSYAYTPGEYREAVRLINERTVDVRPLIERSVSLEDTPHAFHDLAEGRDQSVKVVIEP